jgi:hypothetical protein
MNTDKPFTFRPSFAELQVGDEFITINHSSFATAYRRRTVTRLTSKYFYSECGNDTLRRDNVYSRKDGTRVGGHREDPNAVIPSPELISLIETHTRNIQATSSVYKLRNKLVNVSPEDAIKIVEFFRNNLPQYL